MRLSFALIVLVVAVLVAIFGMQLNPYMIFILTRILIFMILALGLNILMGYAGQLAFSHAALFGIGAYVTGVLQVRLGVSFPVAFLAAVILTTMIGSLFVLPALRLSGIHLAISTLALAQAVQWVLVNWSSVTYGAGGFATPALELGMGLDKYQSILLLTVVIVAALTILTDNMLRSSFGRRFVAIRDNPIAAASMGVDVTRVKTIAFALSAAYAGVAGALFSSLLGFVSPESFNLDQMVMMQIMVVVGGLSSILGSLIGPIFVVLLIELLRDTRGILEILFGAVLIGFVLYQPLGMAALVGRGLKFREMFLPRALGQPNSEVK